MPITWSILTDDQFPANATPGSTVVGPTTFVSPSTGGAYIDNAGSVWGITSSILTGVALGTTDATLYATDLLERPVAEAQITSKTTATVNFNSAFTTHPSTPCLFLRDQSGAAYLCFCSPLSTTVGLIEICKQSTYGGSLTVLGSSTFNIPSTTSDYQLTFSAIGATPTQLSASIAQISAPNTILGQVQLLDSTSALQSAGVAALSANFSTTQFKRFTTYSATGTPNPVVGTLSASEASTGITLSLSSNASGGAGSPYTYRIYRGTDANFTANAASLLATVSSMPYTDTTVVKGTQYFYGLVAVDSAGATVASLPSGLSFVGSIPVQYVAAMNEKQPLAVVFIGDSITWGSGVTNVGTVLSPTVPFFVISRLSTQLDRLATGANKGSSGSTTTDWAPGGTLYNGAVQKSNGSSAANVLLAANPMAKLVVNICLGMNDSASSGTNNGGVGRALSPSEYFAKMNAIVNQILTTDFPNATIFLQPTIWYSPNLSGTSSNLQPGLSLIAQYNQQLSAVAALYQGKVFVGSGIAYDYFSENYQAECQAESGAYGTFYRYPSGTVGSNGKIGTQSLGEFWAQSIASYFQEYVIPVYATSIVPGTKYQVAASTSFSTPSGTVDVKAGEIISNQLQAQLLLNSGVQLLPRPS